MTFEMLIDMLETLGWYTVEPVWVPVLAWTVLAGLAHLAVSRSRHFHPMVEYSMIRALYWALPVGVLLAVIFDAHAFLIDTGVGAGSPSTGASVSVDGSITAESSGASGGAPWRLYQVAGALTVIAAAVAFWRFVQLAGLMLHLRGFRQTLTKIRGRSDVQHTLAAVRREMSVDSNVHLSVGAEGSVPMTFGLFSPAIVIPPSVAADKERLRMTLIHELTHVRRRDYLQRCLEQTVAAVFAVHPLVGQLCRDIQILREITCDGNVLERLSCSRGSYARLLYEVAAASPQESRAIALSEHAKNLKRRIEAMHDFNYSFDHSWNAKRIGLLVGSLMLAGLTFAVACSEMAGPKEPATSVEQQEDSEEAAVFVAVETMPELKGGLSALREKINYPEQAKENGLEGRVIVQFVVDESGNVTDPTVIKGPGGGLNEEALRVVRQAEFDPGQQRGKPVPVKLSLPIRFSLGEGTTNSDAGDPEAGSSDASTKQESRSEVSVAEPSEEERASTTEAGRISGSVTTADGQPLPGANVVIAGTRKGATTGPDGTYTILGAPSGRHDVRISYVGYATVLIEDVSVSGDLTTTVNAALQREEVGLQEIEAGGD